MFSILTKKANKTLGASHPGIDPGFPAKLHPQITEDVSRPSFTCAKSDPPVKILITNLIALLRYKVIN